MVYVGEDSYFSLITKTQGSSNCDIVEATLPKTNMSPENWWLEDVFPIEIVPF